MIHTKHLAGIKKDAIASLVVFLVAIPLCLGIALASGASFFSGIITGIIGGIVVGILSDSQVSVSGPAAGMIAVVLSSVAVLGSYQSFLLALVFAGLLQMVIGTLRVGFIADYVPSSVISGLLAAIGILIIIKQLPIAFGLFPTSDSFNVAISAAQETLSLKPLATLMHHIGIVPVAISIITLAIMLFWGKIPVKALQILPAPIVAVIVAVVFSKLLSVYTAGVSLTGEYFVSLPVSSSWQSLLSEFQHPNLAAWSNANVYIYGCIIAVVASLETLLNLEAAEKLDPHHRYCSRNKELVAQGVGNVISGALGGLPITSVIVRTSVNIHSGNHSKWSAILHGILLLVAIAFIPHWMNMIPLAALAAILIATGYKLASISLFKKMYSAGWASFASFIVTIVAIVFTNLLLGILIGLAVGLFVILQKNTQSSLLQIKEKRANGDYLRIKLPQQVSFLNKAAILTMFNNIPSNSNVIIDADSTNYIDTDILEVIKDFQEVQAPDRGIAVSTTGLEARYELSSQSNFITATTLDTQERISAEQILTVLKEGNQRFINNTPIHKDFKHHREVTAKSQHPLAVVLSCIDSRVPVEQVFDLNVGDVFVTRIAGNVINSDILGGIEFACEVAKAKLIIVLGHKRCGAVSAAYDGFTLGHFTGVLSKISPAVSLYEQNPQASNLFVDSDSAVDKVACINIGLVQKQLIEDSDIVKNLHATNRVSIVGAMYDVSTGKVSFADM